MNNNQDRNGCCKNCLADILKVILILQDNAECGDACLDTCDRGFLGQQVSMSFYNTRPIVLYTCNTGSTPLAMPISKDPAETTTSSVCRIEKLDDCCATFRVLVANEVAEGDPITYTSTNSFFTINLDCLCIVRCLGDTYIENI